MNPFQTNTVQPQNRFTPSMFMTPQGNVYVIDSPLEVANVPMGTGLSVAICPNESLMYLKMYQNGAPSITAYKLAPFQNNGTAVPGALSSDTSASTTDVRNLSFTKVIRVNPSCCAVNNQANLTFVNTGLGAIYTNANVVITKLA